MSGSSVIKIPKAIFKGAVWMFCRLLPVKKNKIVISSYYGRGYGDNPKYISEELLKRNTNADIVWLVKSKAEADTLPAGIRPVYTGSMSSVYHLSTAKIWIDNCRKYFMFKRKNQLYIQTWHGFALKRIEKDVADKLGRDYCKLAEKDSAGIDLIISDSDFMTKIYKNSFWYSGEISLWGSPRNDGIINGSPAVCDKVRSHFSLNPETKTVLYAPTFRADHSMDCYSVDFERLIKTCEKKFGSDFAVLVRLHPNIADKCSFLKYSDKILNATPYPDMQELLEFADIVITDYSSLMFDFSLKLKPCFQFATDIENYKGDRNFYFDLSTLPFDMCTDNDELENAINSFDRESYDAKLTAFFDSVGMIRDGNASAKCADLIIKTINE